MIIPRHVLHHGPPLPGADLISRGVHDASNLVPRYVFSYSMPGAASVSPSSSLSLLSRSLYSTELPAPRTRLQDNPTLLFSWWCTGFATVIILFRLAGRWVRTERMFREDKIMALSMVPLLVRMALIHLVLLYGTNNVNAAGMSAEELHRRSIGSRLVIAARIFYTLFIWMAKYTISEFLKRLTEKYWKRSYEIVLRCIRIFLAVTFIAVVVATLSECQPFDHFWQVSPDPGPKCRQGYTHLITMGVTDVITDILLIVFPIPIIVRSAMPLKRKISLILLFSMSIGLIVITVIRVPSVIKHHGTQQYRTVFASGEILAAAAISNAVILGSFLRDRGVKKIKKYKFGSTTDSMDRPSLRSQKIYEHEWGSDEDLVRDVGYRLGDPGLQASRGPVQRPPRIHPSRKAPKFQDTNWDAPPPSPRDGTGTNGQFRNSLDSDPKTAVDDQRPPSPTDTRPSARRQVSFFDVGGLLDEQSSLRSSTLVPSPTASTMIATTSHRDFAASSLPSPPRKGSRTLLADLGGIFSLSPTSRRPSGSQLSTRFNRSGLTSGALQDVGGLLNDTTPVVSPLLLSRAASPQNNTTANHAPAATSRPQLPPLFVPGSSSPPPRAIVREERPERDTSMGPPVASPPEALTSLTSPVYPLHLSNRSGSAN